MHAAGACWVACIGSIAHELIVLRKMHRERLELDHKQNNPLFASWKLSKALSVSEQTVSLNSQVATSEHSTDYLSTRAAVLHNHVNHQYGRMYVFCTSNESISLQKICISEPSLVRSIWGRLHRYPLPITKRHMSCAESRIRDAQSPQQLSRLLVQVRTQQKSLLCSLQWLKCSHWAQHTKHAS